MPLKRKADGSFSYEFPYKKYKYEQLSLPAPVQPLLLTGRRTRRYTRRTRKYGRGYRYRSTYFSRPLMRGYSKVNRSLPELKSLDIIFPFLPVSFGNVTDPANYPVAPTLQWTGPTTDIFTRYNGTNAAGVLLCLNGAIAGSGLNNRVGRQVNCKSLLVQCTWRLKTALDDTQQPAAIRTMVVWDRSPNSVMPPLSDILTPIFHVQNQYPMPGSPNNLTYRDRFRTLWDVQDTLIPGADSLRQYDKYIRLNGRTVYSAPGTASPGFVDIISSGALYLILLSDQSDGDTPTAINLRPVCKVSTRFRFTDN